jgi:hypothetical protein
VFPLVVTVTMIVMVCSAARAPCGGPGVGAVALFVIQEIVWARYPYVHPLLFGAIIVAVVLLMPRGVLGLLQLKYRLPRTDLMAVLTVQDVARSFGGVHRRSTACRSCSRRADLRLIGPQRLGQDDALQLHHRARAARRGRVRFKGQRSTAQALQVATGASAAPSR